MAKKRSAKPKKEDTPAPESDPTASSVRDKYSQRIAEVEGDLKELTAQLEKMRQSRVFPFFMFSSDAYIDSETVSTVYDRLDDRFGECEKLDVLVESSGGQIDPAFHLARLFARYAIENLTFIVPRWAKSAATLLICGGDAVLMGPTSELGPVDPQIFDPSREETYSPLDIQSGLDLIDYQYKRGNARLADILANKLQTPLTLGKAKKSLQIGEQYIEKLVSERMYAEDTDKPKAIATSLVRDYSHHGYCIDVEEARRIGLNIEEPDSEEWNTIWQIRKKARKLDELRYLQEIEEFKQKAPPFPEELRQKLKPIGLGGGRNRSGQSTGPSRWS